MQVYKALSTILLIAVSLTSAISPAWAATAAVAHDDTERVLPGSQPAPFNGERDGNSPLVEVVSANSREVVLDLTLAGLDEQTIEVNGRTFQRLSLPGAGSTDEVGRPELPTVGRMVALPIGAQPTVELLESTIETRTGYTIYPAQEPPTDQPGEPTPPFTVDEAFYGQDVLYPTQWVEADAASQLRDLAVTTVRFNPVRYNPARSEVQIATHLRVRVTFQGGGLSFASTASRSPYFEDIYQHLLLNYETVEQTAPAGEPMMMAASANGADLLIVTHPDFESQANALAEWKNRRGILTVVKTTTETGTTAEAIKNYIQTAYDTWNPAPSYVLFLGDAEYVPTNYLTIHSAHGTRIGTDLYYATVAGSDYFPDIATGRIPVDTATQAQTVVDKIINYERNPTTVTRFYQNALVAGYFQDSNNDGRADRLFTQTSEEIRDFLTSAGYSVQREYTTNSSDPQKYYAGTSIPAELRKPGFAWDGNAASINSAINSGIFLLNHRDHGYRGGWGDPWYTTGNINDLSNGDLLPVIFSINCETGWFDQETDEESYTGESFAEQFLRKSGGGAVGIIAATRISYSWYNDYLVKGMYDGLWSDFNTSYPSGSNPFSNGLYRLGDAVNFGKYYLASVYGDSSIRQYEFEIFHYFGDPTMELWTGVPQDLTVSHAATATLGAMAFTVDVAENGALVALYQNGKLLGRAIASDGRASVALSTPLTDSTLYVTVNKHNYRPYESTVAIASGPTYSISGYVRTESGDGVANIPVTISSYGPTDTNSNGYFSQSGLVAGLYTVTVNENGYVFSPTSQTLTLGPNAENVNFTAMPQFVAASVPFSDTFDSGSLGTGWTTETTANGRVRVDTSYPFSGSHSVLLDADPARTYSHASIILTLNLSGHSQATLDFWWREFNDENHNDDGVFISDDLGETWHRALSFNGGPNEFTHSVIDLDVAAAENGLRFNDHFQIKFQFYDNYSTPNDGYAIDEVRVTVPPQPTVEVLSFPDVVHSGQKATIQWKLSGGNTCTLTEVQWGPTQAGLSNSSVSDSGEMGVYSYTLTMPSSDKIYFRIHAVIDGVDFFSEPEQVISILNARPTSYPAKVGPGEAMTIQWTLSGGTRVNQTNLRWGTKPDALDNTGRSMSGSMGSYEDVINAPATANRIYFQIHAVVDGHDFSSDEQSIEVNSQQQYQVFLPAVMANSK